MFDAKFDGAWSICNFGEGDSKKKNIKLQVKINLESKHLLKLRKCKLSTGLKKADQ
jgi:hypothetical protein